MNESVTPPDDTAERWLPVIGWEGFYEVSDNGRVRRVERTVIRSNGWRLRIPAQIMNPWIRGSSSPAVTLRGGGRQANKAVDVLVQQAFGLSPAMQAVPDPGEAERWLAVAGYQGLYEISDLGRVRSFHVGPSGKRGGLLRPAPTGVHPHLCVVLCKDGEHRTRLVHQLVLEAFVGPRPNGLESLHGPGGAFDNRLVNLSWGSKSQNNGADKVRDGTTGRGDRAWKVKLTEADVAECRRRYVAGETFVQIASAYGLSRQGMASAIRGTNWSWLPGAVEPERRGKRHRAKLTAAIVLECRARRVTGEDTGVLASEFGVAKVTMHQAIVGRTWRHLQDPPLG